MASQLDRNNIKYTREYHAVPGRKFRFDFCIKAGKLLVEVNGGIFLKRGAHSTGTGLTRDYEKTALAMIEGWRVLAVSTSQVYNGDALKWINALLWDDQMQSAPSE